MKLALISAGLFLVSYAAVNRGLGPHPLQLLVPLLVVVGTAIAARWFMRRDGGLRPRKDAEADGARFARDILAEERTPPHPRMPPTSQRASPPVMPRPPGNKARKLF